MMELPAVRRTQCYNGIGYMVKDNSNFNTFSSFRMMNSPMLSVLKQPQDGGGLFLAHIVQWCIEYFHILSSTDAKRLEAMCCVLNIFGSHPKFAFISR